MKRVAAIDWGTKRIGLAVSDERGVIALPLTVVDAGRNETESARNVLQALKSYLPQMRRMIVGLPLLMSGVKGEMALRVEKFVGVLRGMTEVDVECVDERLTSAQAEKALKEWGSRRERAKVMDATSATLLLQAYLDGSR